MADSQLINTLHEYFKKLNRVLETEADFNFFGCKIIKKNCIDDVLCCILATLPQSYKNILKEAKAKRFSSMIAYKLLFNSVKQKFILNSNVYLVNSNNAKKYIRTFIDNIEGDIDYIEKNFS